MMLSAFSGVAQGGINFAPGALALKFDRFNPVSKLGQIFSPVGLSNLLKSLLPFGSHSLDRNQLHSRQLGNDGARLQPRIEGLRRLCGQHGVRLDLEAGLVLLLWSAVDYVFTLMKMNSDMKMTKQEVREEHKESDGNPVIKSRIHRLRRAMRRSSL
jgi:flagellar biosynthetic protein FlhB